MERFSFQSFCIRGKETLTLVDGVISRKLITSLPLLRHYCHKGSQLWSFITLYMMQLSDQSLSSVLKHFLASEHFFTFLNAKQEQNKTKGSHAFWHRPRYMLKEYSTPLSQIIFTTLGSGINCSRNSEFIHRIVGKVTWS